MNYIAVRVHWRVKLPNSLIQVSHFHLGHGYVIEWVILTNLQQFRVFLDTEHFIEQLKRFVGHLGFFESLHFLI